MVILNLTQHAATDAQLAEGVINLDQEKWERVKELLTINGIPERLELVDRADAIASIAEEIFRQKEIYLPRYALIAGEPFFMSHLERSLQWRYIKYLYAFSQRDSRETVADDGTIVKVSVSRHVGFVNVN